MPPRHRPGMSPTSGDIPDAAGDVPERPGMSGDIPGSQSGARAGGQRQEEQSVLGFPIFTQELASGVPSRWQRLWKKTQAVVRFSSSDARFHRGGCVRGDYAAKWHNSNGRPGRRPGEDHKLILASRHTTFCATLQTFCLGIRRTYSCRSVRCLCAKRAAVLAAVLARARPRSCAGARLTQAQPRVARRQHAAARLLDGARAASIVLMGSAGRGGRD